MMDFQVDQSKHHRRNFVKGGFMAAVGIGGAQALGGTAPIPAGGTPANLLSESRTVRIPGDYPTLQDAVREESKWFPQHFGTSVHGAVYSDLTQRVTIMLHIESGHKLKSGASFWNGSYGHFYITSDDDVVEVADDFAGDLISVRRAIGPVLATMIDMRGRGRNGYWCENAFGYIEEAHVAGGKICGIRNARVDGVLSAHGGNMRIGERDSRDGELKRHGEVSGSGRFNIHCAVGSVVSARFAVLSNAKGLANVLAAHTSMVTCDSADCSGGAEIGVMAGSASQVDAAYANVTNCGRHGLSAERCSTMRAVGADASGSGSGVDIRVRGGGMIDVTDAHTTRGTPSIQDTNLSSFNTTFGQGILFNEKA